MNGSVLKFASVSSLTGQQWDKPGNDRLEKWSSYESIGTNNALNLNSGLLENGDEW